MNISTTFFMPFDFPKNSASLPVSLLDRSVSFKILSHVYHGDFTHKDFTFMMLVSCSRERRARVESMYGRSNE
jgi:hypothetical protein